MISLISILMTMLFASLDQRTNSFVVGNDLEVSVVVRAVSFTNEFAIGKVHHPVFGAIALFPSTFKRRLLTIVCLDQESRLDLKRIVVSIQEWDVVILIFIESESVRIIEVSFSKVEEFIAVNLSSATPRCFGYHLVQRQ